MLLLREGADTKTLGARLIRILSDHGVQSAADEAHATAATKALVERLTAQADAWDKAIVRKDRAAIEANMAEDFRQIDRAGGVETKKSFVDGIVSPDLEIDPYVVEDFDVRLYGDVALLSGRTRMTGRYQGKPFASHYRYIDVYVRRGDEWKIVSVQISPIPASAPLGEGGSGP
jgi:ketosteroid isomerase-like protein